MPNLAITGPILGSILGDYLQKNGGPGYNPDYDPYLDMPGWKQQMYKAYNQTSAGQRNPMPIPVGAIGSPVGGLDGFGRGALLHGAVAGQLVKQGYHPEDAQRIAQQYTEQAARQPSWLNMSREQRWKAGEQECPQAQPQPEAQPNTNEQLARLVRLQMAQRYAEAQAQAQGKFTPQDGMVHVYDVPNSSGSGMIPGTQTPASNPASW